MLSVKFKTDFLLDISMDSKLIKKVKQIFSKTPVLPSVASNIIGPGEDETPPSPTAPDEN